MVATSDNGISFIRFCMAYRNRLKSQRQTESVLVNRRIRARNRIRNRQFGLETMTNMTDFEFSRMFRLSRSSFQVLLTKIRSNIERNEQKAINSSGSGITATIRLATALRFLAGGSYLDISFMFGLDSTNFFNSKYVLWSTIEAIDTILDLSFSLHPDDLQKTADGFAKYSNGHMTGCVMAIDGWVCHTRKPKYFEVGGSVSSYRNRKQCWGIVCMAGCDASCRFTLFSAQASGGTIDYIAWDFCGLKSVLDQGELPNQYYFIGDEAFVNTSQILVPWSGRGLGEWKDSFNYHLSAMRQCIKRAFGLLTRRWEFSGDHYRESLIAGQ